MAYLLFRYELYNLSWLVLVFSRVEAPAVLQVGVASLSRCFTERLLAKSILHELTWAEFVIWPCRYMKPV